MTRYHPYPRRELRGLFSRWLSANRVRLAVVLVGALVLLAFETWLFAVLDVSPALRWYLIGFIHAAVVSACVIGVGISFLTHEPQAIRHVRGAWGEDFTRDELVRARSKKLIWGWVDSVTLQTGDIDHLVVTRSGGLIAIDTKWRSSPHGVDHRDMVKDARRVKVRAEGIIQTVLSTERGSHRARTRTRVTPLVVVWGAAEDAVPEEANIGGIDFVAGGRLVDWLRRFDGETVDEDAAADLLARLEGFRSTAWSSATR